MRTFKRLISAIMPVMLIAALMLSSCSKQEVKEGNIIPKDAAFVTCIDFGSIWEKGEMDKLNDLGSIKEMRQMLQNQNPSLDKFVGELLQDPSSSGIDMKDNLLYFSANQNKDVIYVMTCKMKDADAFESFFKKTTVMAGGREEDVKFEKDSKSGLSYMDIGGLIIAYNDDRFLSVWPEGRARISLLDYANDLLNMDEKQSIATSESFNEYWKNRGDFSYYMDFANFMNIMDNSSNKEFSYALALLPKDFSEAFDKMSLYYAVSFEKGAIEIKSETIGVPESIDKIRDQKFNKDLIKYMPEKALIAGTFAFNTENLVALFDDVKGPGNLLNQHIDIKNYRIKDVINAFGGSVAIDFYGMMNNETPAIAVALDIKDKNVIKDILAELGLDKDGNIYSDRYDENQYIYLGDDVVIFSTDADVMKKASRGGYSEGMKNIAEKAGEGNYFYMELDPKKYPQVLLDEIDEDLFERYYYDYYTEDYKSYVDEEGRDTFYSILGWFKNVEITTDNSKSITKINLADDTDNSLAFIIKQLDRLSR